MMDHLFRELAPVSSTGWNKIQAELKQVLNITI